jgi:hypothetical protein
LAMATCWAGDAVSAVALLRQSAALALQNRDADGEVFSQSVLGLLGFLHTGIAGGDPLEHLRVARSRHAHGMGDSPAPTLLVAIEGLVAGGPLDDLPSGLTRLHNRWLRALCSQVESST